MSESVCGLMAISTASAVRSLALLVCAAGAWAGSPWNPDDIWSWRTPRDPQISPDGRRVVYLEDWNEHGSDSVYSSLWLVSIDDKQPLCLTDAPFRMQSPRWSPDSTRIAWSSGQGSLNVLTVGGDGAKATSVGVSPLALAWSRDGQSIAFTALVPPPPGTLSTTTSTKSIGADGTRTSTTGTTYNNSNGVASDSVTKTTTYPPPVPVTTTHNSTTTTTQ